MAPAILLLCGCGHHDSPSSVPPPSGVTASLDPSADLYKKLRTADYEVDGAFNELNDSLDGCKALAPKAGGDAEQAILSVIELLDGAGEALADYENVPETVDEFKKDFAAQDERRLRSIKIVLDALKKTSNGLYILEDLSANVPANFKKDMGAIIDNVSQAQSDLRDSVTSMGGQIPPDAEEQSQDPAQDSAGDASGDLGKDSAQDTSKNSPSEKKHSKATSR